MRDEIAFLAGPRDWGVTRESWLARVPAKVPSVSCRTVKALWYGEIRDTEHWAARDIRRAAQVQKAKQEAEKLAQQLQSAAIGLNVIDPNFHEHTVAALLGIVRQLSNKDRT